MNIMLKKAAINFNHLKNKEFHVTYGKNGIKTTVIVIFEEIHFYHLAGLHYIRDMQDQLNQGRVHVYNKLLSDSNLYKEIENSQHYSEIKARVELVLYLERLLDNDIYLYKYNSVNKLPYSKVEYDYLIKGRYKNKVVNIFLKEDHGIYYVCNSIFYQKDDYARIGRSLAILSKEFKRRV
jgi:hypothetical protein